MKREQRVGTDDKPIDPTLYKSGEGCIEIGFGTCVYDEKVLSDLAGSGPYVAQLELEIRILRIEQHADQFGLGHDRVQKVKPRLRRGGWRPLWPESDPIATTREWPTFQPHQSS